MNLREFFDFRKKCIVCNQAISIILIGNIQEKIDEDASYSLVAYSFPIFRKKFLTFGSTEASSFLTNPDLDATTFNKDKYNSFLIDKDGYASFDEDFNFKMKFCLKGFCNFEHYTFTSRDIKISNKSSDITKGYDVIAEDVRCENYVVSSNSKKNITLIYDINQKEPISIPYKNILSFPLDDKEKFIKKIENILLLA